MGWIKERVDFLVDREADKILAEHKKLPVWVSWEVDVKTRQRTKIIGIYASHRAAQLSLPAQYQTMLEKFPADSPHVLRYLQLAIERRHLES